MLVIEPWDAKARGDASLADLRGAIAGASVGAVRYVVPPGETWPEGHREDRAHEVDMAVDLVMSTGAVLSLSWAMDGLNEGMAIELREPGESDADLPGDTVDVSDHVDWERFLGADIVEIRPDWHVPNDGCPESPWAYRLGFSNKSSLVIALGSAEGKGFTYMPDELIVFFDESLAASYTIPASDTSSRG
ncbi:hypothetical protein SLITK23_75650 [Streptomyces lividans]|uniref:Uncharacterized protein n=2 Tax=Streptomyces violaceoruber group TaxID=2867121 RepID=A0ABN3TBC0_9ACTN|nr:hypothetical protein SLITK23_75650 [Streptomyces lividans]